MVSRKANEIFPNYKPRQSKSLRMDDYYGDIGGASIFKKHAAWYINNEKNASMYRVKINQSETIDDMKKVINEFFLSLA